MLTLVSYLQAHDPDQNLHRFYRIEYGQDLFDQWIVEVNYGRVGCKGRSLITLFDSQKDALSYVKPSLKRRQSSSKRIGVNYESVYSSPSLDGVSLVSNGKELAQVTNDTYLKNFNLRMNLLKHTLIAFKNFGIDIINYAI